MTDGWWMDDGDIDYINANSSAMSKGSHGSQVPFILAKSQYGCKFPTFGP